MSDTVLLQVRISAALVRRIDELCSEGIFRNRSEAVTDAIRMLVQRYSRTSPEARATALYLGGRLSKTEAPEELIFEGSRKNLNLEEELGED
ncbi:MAG: ribbon-helix-helix domain-containing protein [Nitrososphaerota archaeon]